MLKTVGNPSTSFGDQTIQSGNLVIATSGAVVPTGSNTWFSLDGISFKV